MIPETNRGPNAITKRKQAAMTTAVVKWLEGFVIGSGLVIHFTRWFFFGGEGGVYQQRFDSILL